MIGITPYLFIAIWPIFLTLFFPDYKNDEKQRKKLLVLSGIVYVLFIGLRSYAIGSTDSLHYYARMERAIASSTWNGFFDPDGVEAGFQLFVWLLSRVLKEPQVIFLVTGIIYIICMFMVIERESKDIALTIVFYSCLGMLEFELQGMRQSLAMSICLLAFLAAREKKPLRFVALVLIATQFHQTSIVFFLVYPICQLKWNLKDGFLVIFGSCLFILGSPQVAAFGNIVFERSYTYIASSGGFVVLTIYGLAIILALLFNDRIKDSESALLYIAIINFIVYLMRFTGAHAAERVSYYFIFGALLILTNTITNMKGLNERQKNGLSFIAATLSVALFAYHLLNSNLNPYVLFF